MPGKFLFVSGLSGSGKTTLGESLKNNNDFVHFNVDVWAFGGDPIAQSNSVPDPEMMAKRDPIVKEAFDNMIANGFSKLQAGQSVDPTVWETFFALLCPAILSAREASGEKDLVVTFSVYLRSVRDFVRQQLGADLAFVVLNPSIENVGLRKVAHLRNTAAERGLTLSAFLRSFNPSSDAPELPEETIIELLTNQAKGGAVGFEPAEVDEPRTLPIGDVSVEDARQSVLAFLSTL